MKTQQQLNEASENRSCFICKYLETSRCEIGRHIYCSLRDEIDYTFTENLDEEKVANECKLYRDRYSTKN